jgi:hypothetical protein
MRRPPSTVRNVQVVVVSRNDKGNERDSDIMITQNERCVPLKPARDRAAGGRVWPWSRVTARAWSRAVTDTRT